MSEKTDTRTARRARKQATRETTLRPTSWRPPSLLPDPAPSEGYVFRWVRISSSGHQDAENLSKKMREGYVPVKVSDHPELHLQGNDSGEAEVGGLVLCKIPEEFVVQRNNYYLGQSQGQMESVDNSLMRESDPRMPLYSDRRSQVTFGSGQ